MNKKYIKHNSFNYFPFSIQSNPIPQQHWKVMVILSFIHYSLCCWFGAVEHKSKWINAWLSFNDFVGFLMEHEESEKESLGGGNGEAHFIVEWKIVRSRFIYFCRISFAGNKRKNTQNHNLLVAVLFFLYRRAVWGRERKTQKKTRMFQCTKIISSSLIIIIKDWLR